MRHATAVRRLRTIAQRCRQASGLWDEEPFLLAAELTWCCQLQSCVGLPELLQFDKAPVDWYLRPSVWPVANHRIQRPLRIWSLDGVEADALDALERQEAESLRLPAPSPEHAAEQLALEFESSLAHLRSLQESYWEQTWRREHRGYGVYPDHHLWDAVRGYLDLLDAVQNAHCWIPAVSHRSRHRASSPPLASARLFSRGCGGGCVGVFGAGRATRVGWFRVFRRR